MTFFFFFGKHVDTCFKHPLWTVVLILEIHQWVESSPYPCGLYIIITITITANLVWVAVYKGKGEWGMSQAMDHISTLPGKVGSWLFIFSASQEQTKTSEDLELLWSEQLACGLSLGFPHCPGVGPLESRLPAHRPQGWALLCLWGFPDRLWIWKLLLMFSTVY